MIILWMEKCLFARPFTVRITRHRISIRRVSLTARIGLSSLLFARSRKSRAFCFGSKIQFLAPLLVSRKKKHAQRNDPKFKKYRTALISHLIRSCHILQEIISPSHVSRPTTYMYMYTITIHEK